MLLCRQALPLCMGDKPTLADLLKRYESKKDDNDPPEAMIEAIDELLEEGDWGDE